MAPVNLREYIESGEYFNDAKKWYDFKYIYPFSQRSFVAILSIIMCALFIGVLININGLLPIVIKVKYSINSVNSENKTAEIIRANQIQNKPLESIVDIMVKNYVQQRERYNYDLLKKQFTYIKNNSTRIVFRRFYNFMNIDNPASPVMQYQKDVNRKIKILSAHYIGSNKAVVTFHSEARGSTGNALEDIVWQATISYEIDKIDPYLPSGSRFNFTVTDYQLKLIEDKRKK